MQKRCLSYSKSVHPSVGVDVTQRYCVKTMQVRIICASKVYIGLVYLVKSVLHIPILHFRSSILTAP